MGGRSALGRAKLLLSRRDQSSALPRVATAQEQWHTDSVPSCLCAFSFGDWSQLLARRAHDGCQGLQTLEGEARNSSLRPAGAHECSRRFQPPERVPCSNSPPSQGGRRGRVPTRINDIQVTFCYDCPSRRAEMQISTSNRV